ncbi:hypothetical protein IMZ48_09915 [Candidatus Bathyarchaeota archaeon]|nr:hypothetical protein [Candidatus Bathyarchaeota archaeon]
MAWRCTHYDQAIDLIESMVSSIVPTRNTRNSPDTSDLEEFLNLPTTPFFDTGDDVSPEDTTPWDSLSPTNNTSASLSSGAFNTGASSSQPSPNSDRQDPSSRTGSSDPDESRLAAQKVEADACCDICGYRPKGAPQWFKGSMAKHKKLQHSTTPPQIYKCPYPGCTSQYKNRPDNLRQHQFDKEHFVEGDEASRRPSKRKKTT